jgi:hypothetical protein
MRGARLLLSWQQCGLRSFIMYNSAFSRSWRECPNCKQPYQNQISLDLSSAFVSFAEANYNNPGKCIIGSQLTNDKVNLMDALRERALSLLNHAFYINHRGSKRSVKCS